jgi:hypothetical protein
MVVATNAALDLEAWRSAHSEAKWAALVLWHGSDEFGLHEDYRVTETDLASARAVMEDWRRNWASRPMPEE